MSPPAIPGLIWSDVSAGPRAGKGPVSFPILGGGLGFSLERGHLLGDFFFWVVYN